MTDYVLYLEDYLMSIEDVPNEIHHIFSELKDRDMECAEIQAAIQQNEESLLQKLVARGGATAPTRSRPSRSKDPDPGERRASVIESAGPSNAASSQNPAVPPSTLALTMAGPSSMAGAVMSPEALRLYEQIEKDFARCQQITVEKLAMTEKITEMLDRHVRRINADLDRMEEAEEPPAPAPGTPASYVPSGQGGLSVTGPGAIKRDPSTSLFAVAPATAATGARIAALKRKANSRSPAAQKRAAMKRQPATFWDVPVVIDPSNPDLIKRRPSRDETPDADEQIYCVCQQVSYGEMIACDNADCAHEWFHLACVGLDKPPEGHWLCPECRAAAEAKTTAPATQRARKRTRL